MKRIVERFIVVVVFISADDIIRKWFVWAIAVRIFFGGSGKKLVRNSHFHVVGFTRKHGDGLVLRFPSEASYGAVVAAAIRMARDPERRTQLCGGIMLGKNFPVLNGFDQPQTGHLQRNAKSQIASSQFCFKIRLCQRAVGNRGIIGAPTDCPELMDSTVASTVGLVLEAHLADRPILLFEAGHSVLPSKTVWHEAKL